MRLFGKTILISLSLLLWALPALGLDAEIMRLNRDNQWYRFLQTGERAPKAVKPREKKERKISEKQRKAVLGDKYHDRSSRISDR